MSESGINDLVQSLKNKYAALGGFYQAAKQDKQNLAAANLVVWVLNSSSDDKESRKRACEIIKKAARVTEAREKLYHFTCQQSAGLPELLNGINVGAFRDFLRYSSALVEEIKTGKIHYVHNDPYRR